MNTVAHLLAAEEAAHPLVMPDFVFGVIALVVFAILAFAVFTYRDVANRHSNKTSKSSGGHH